MYSPNPPQQQPISIYAINLKHRPDRAARVLQQFQSCTDYTVQLVEAVSTPNGAVGCFMSHQKCVGIAKSLNLEYVIVVEDDCEPCADFNDRMKVILPHLAATQFEWSIYLGGTFKTRPYDVLAHEKIPGSPEVLCSVKYGYCTHFVIYNRSVYDAVLAADPERMPIDHWLWTLPRPETTLLVSSPFVATQSGTDASDISASNDNRTINRRIKRTNIILSTFIRSKYPTLKN